MSGNPIVEILVDKKNQAFYGTLDIFDISRPIFHDPKTQDFYNDLAYGMMPMTSENEETNVLGNFDWYLKAETAVRK